MAAHDPLGRKRRFAGGPSLRRRCAALALVMAVSAALPPASSGAAGIPAKPKDLKKEYAKLKKRADALNKEYRGELVSLDQAKKAAERAGLEADRLTRDFETARADLSRFAASSYMSGRFDTIPMVTSGDPRSAIRDMTVVEHLSRNTGRRIESLETLASQASRSRQAATAKLADVRKEIDDLEGQRARVKKLLAKYKPETPSGGSGTPGRPDGAPKTKSPLIGPSMTSRMRTLMLAIDGKYGPFPAIGCSRPGDPQDHGSGTACDFMESTGGKMPSSGARAHGDAVAQFVISNASRYGVKYVIWRQRIYDMRGSGGWKSMSDRGSITANHYDHVHVSVL
ncbi:coiled-coil domain-containing protein [Spirillospora sp. NPDC048911]|uniref:coiled-coil domain-containing protein n=1 Tax=Spirillospora sp. NPDC048911 TaxID=3364527 RepID=UPI003714B564